MTNINNVYVSCAAYEATIMAALNDFLLPELSTIVLADVPFCDHGCDLNQRAIVGYCDVSFVACNIECEDEVNKEEHDYCKCCERLCAKCKQLGCKKCVMMCDNCGHLLCNNCWKSWEAFNKTECYCVHN